jgi:membrane dipeptidase
MRAGGVDAVFFAIWTPPNITGPEAVRRALNQIEAVRREVERHGEHLQLATDTEGIRRASEDGRIAVLLGIEGGHLMGNDLANLRKFYALGARYMTLTHSANVDWADSSTDEPAHNGLTEFGKEVIRTMNRLGMMVDISHVSDRTFYDVLATSEAPLVATHSCCRALCDSPRNLSDEMIRALAKTGGVLQVNFHTGFVSQAFRNRMRAEPEVQRFIDGEARRRCGENDACQLLESGKLVREFVRDGKLPRVEWTEILDHIEYAVKLVGAEHVGLGSDFDGAYMPHGMEDASHLPQITSALLKKGYSEENIQKILGGNMLRLMQDVESTAQKMEGTP